MVIICFVLAITGAGYGAIEYNKLFKLINEANDLAGEEKYSEANEKLKFTQNNWLVNVFGIKKHEINIEIEKNIKLDEDKLKYLEGITQINNGNLETAIDLLSKFQESSFYYQKAQTKIEEARRKILESQLSKEKIDRKIAEAKASQEEYEKKLKEKELADKAAYDKMMNADNDLDGLTYKRESELGTSDWNTDSDYDAVPDNLDMHPTGGGRNLAQYFKWTYDGDIWEYTLSIPEDWYEYFKNNPRVPHGTAYVTFEDPYIKKIAEKIKTTAESNGYHEMSFILSFVQGLPYVADSYTNFDEYPKYPIETIIDRNGDCEDTAYLFAALVRATGIGAALIQFSDHMGVGVQTVHSQSGYYYPVGENWYYYSESTGIGFEIGNLPDEYKYHQAKVMIVGQEGSQLVYPQYVKKCIYASQFPGYYFDGKNFYSDSQCNNLINCIYYEGFYFKPGNDSNSYWDNNCTQIFVKDCLRGPSNYSNYFCIVDEDNYCIEYYSDSRCMQKARVCRYYYSDTYYDGYDKYWDSACTQKKLSWCTKSIYKPGYYFNSIDSNYYYDYQCIQKTDL